jgi:hypothetical protein
MSNDDLPVLQHQHTKIFNGYCFILPVLHAIHIAVAHYQLLVAVFKKAGVFYADGAFYHTSSFMLLQRGDTFLKGVTSIIYVGKE